MYKSKVYVTKEPVVLNGYQAIFKPTEYGYSLAADITDESLIEELEVERVELIAYQESKLKNKKRASLKPTPWIEDDDRPGVYNLKFGWKGDKVPVFDANGTPIFDENLKLYSGSRVRIAFVQSGYTLKDGTTYGTSVKLKSIQVIELASHAEPKLSLEEAASLLGTFEGGFQVGDIPDAAGDDEETDTDF